MKRVIRYQCQFCKKEFKTPNKHRCKKNPELKNCFSCKKLNGWVYDYGDTPQPDCLENEDWDIVAIKSVNYNMQCQHWESEGRE